MTVIVVKGTARLRQKLKAINPALSDAVKKEMFKILVQMDAEIKSDISGGSRSGNRYVRRKGGKTKSGKFRKGSASMLHTASAPGELPKTDRGNLVASFLFNVEATPGRVLGKLMNRSKHAAPLEFKPASQGGRPFMRPLYNKWAPIANKRLTAALNDAIKKQGK